MNVLLDDASALEKPHDLTQRRLWAPSGRPLLSARKVGQPPPYAVRVGLKSLSPDSTKTFVNLKTGKALGVETPPTLLAGADDVIE
jgi:hypothetical protein